MNFESRMYNFLNVLCDSRRLYLFQEVFWGRRIYLGDLALFLGMGPDLEHISD